MIGVEDLTTSSERMFCGETSPYTATLDEHLDTQEIDSGEEKAEVCSDYEFDRMKRCLELHGSPYNRKPTHPISVTPDLLRALNIAGTRVSQGRTGVTIITIDMWGLGGGNYTSANALRQKCGLAQDPIYETEVLVWGQVSSEAISARWTWQALNDSGIFKALPSLDKVSPGRSLESLRSTLEEDRAQFSVSNVLFALQHLGMDPSSFHTKQVFEFLLGQALGYRVPRRLLTIERILLTDRGPEMEEYDRSAHRLATMLWRKALISHYKSESRSSGHQYESFWVSYGMKTRRGWRKAGAAMRAQHFCPDFKHWWARREESDLSDWEAHEIIQQDTYGIKGWMRD